MKKGVCTREMVQAIVNNRKYNNLAFLETLRSDCPVNFADLDMIFHDVCDSSLGQEYSNRNRQFVSNWYRLVKDQQMHWPYSETSASNSSQAASSSAQSFSEDTEMKSADLSPSASAVVSGFSFAPVFCRSIATGHVYCSSNLVEENIAEFLNK